MGREKICDLPQHEGPNPEKGPHERRCLAIFPKQREEYPSRTTESERDEAVRMEEWKQRKQNADRCGGGAKIPLAVPRSRLEKRRPERQHSKHTPESHDTGTLMQEKMR